MSDGPVGSDGNAPFASWPGLRLRTSVEPTPVTETQSTPAPPAAQEFRFVLESKLIAEQPPQTSDGSEPDGLPPSRYEHGLWRAGWTDGRLGETPDPQLQLVASQGALTRAVRTADAKRKVADAEAEEKHQKFLADERKKEWDDIAGEYERVVSDRRQNAVAYSKTLAWVYLIFGVLIFLADMPLSFNVAPALGVELRREPTEGGDAVSADNLTHLIQNFGALWEPFAVAVGIAALTIAFKIVIDKLHRPFRFGTWWSKSLLFAFMAATVGALVWAFVLIGQARASYDGSGPPVNSAALFTMLAIMFPVVCGYCFSMARAAWQNVAHYDRVAKEHGTAWSRHIETHLAYQRAAANTTSAREELKAVENDRVEEDFLRNLYLHGFQRGRCVPETLAQDASLYDRCESMLHHWLAQLSQTNREAAEREA